ncbi:hypothetical protein D3C86_1812210 [compost metagenome]
MALVIRRDITGPVKHLPAPGAADFEQFTVHMNNVTITGAFMQVVDVLRDQQKTIAQLLLQFCQRQMCRIWRNFWRL